MAVTHRVPGCAACQTDCLVDSRDLRVALDRGAAGEEAARSDRIEDAVDYRDVAATVREVSDARAYNLLEALAAAVADALLERFPLSRAVVRVHKPDVRLDPPVEAAAITVERAR